MRVNVYDVEGKVVKKMELGHKELELRRDLIKRAFLAEMSKERQPYGTDKLAGKRTSAHYHGRRHVRWSMMNREMARMKRIHNQGFLNYTARFVPQAVKGRKAHPPKVEKVWEQKINKKERLKALAHAAFATFKRDVVEKRGHLIGDLELPIVFVDEIEKIEKSKKVINAMEKIGLGNEIERARRKKVRAGRGKMRGRRYRKKKGILFIVNDDKIIKKAARNIAGVDVAKIGELSVKLLAPGGDPGRLTVWSESALKRFYEDVVRMV